MKALLSILATAALVTLIAWPIAAYIAPAALSGPHPTTRELTGLLGGVFLLALFWGALLGCRRY